MLLTDKIKLNANDHVSMSLPIFSLMTEDYKGFYKNAEILDKNHI